MCIRNLDRIADELCCVGERLTDCGGGSLKGRQASGELRTASSFLCPYQLVLNSTLLFVSSVLRPHLSLFGLVKSDLMRGDLLDGAVQVVALN